MRCEKRQKTKLPGVSLKQRFLNHGSAKGNYKASLTGRVNYNAAVTVFLLEWCCHGWELLAYCMASGFCWLRVS